MRTLEEVIAEMPAADRAEVSARTKELKIQYEALKQLARWLRKNAGVRAMLTPMTKSELLEALESLSDDNVIMFTLDEENFRDFSGVEVWSGGDGPPFAVLVAEGN